MDSRPAVISPPIAAAGGRSHYDAFAVWLHWSIALLVGLQFALSQLWDFAPKPEKHLMIVAHMSFGILLAVAVVLSIFWRFAPAHRVRPAWDGPLEWLTVTVHWGLLLLLVAQAALGFLLRWSGDESMSFFGLPIPPPFAPWSKEAHHQVGELHEWIGWAIVIVALGHALVAVWHHVWLRDDVLWRMTPGQTARRMTERRPSPQDATD